jgi:hypothetical protein
MGISKHELANRKNIALAELANENFILFDKGTIVHEPTMDGCLPRGRVRTAHFLRQPASGKPFGIGCTQQRDRINDTKLSNTAAGFVDFIKVDFENSR